MLIPALLPHGLRIEISKPDRGHKSGDWILRKQMEGQRSELGHWTVPNRSPVLDRAQPIHLMARHGEQPGDDLSAACLDATTEFWRAQQRCRAADVLDQVLETFSGSRMSSSDLDRLVDGVVDNCLRRALSLRAGPHGIGSWGRTGVVVTRRTSISTRWRGQSPTDPCPSAGEPGGTGCCLSFETDNGLAHAHGRDSQRGHRGPSEWTR